MNEINWDECRAEIQRLILLTPQQQGVIDEYAEALKAKLMPDAESDQMYVAFDFDKMKDASK
jgi:hypothetical protein